MLKSGKVQKASDPAPESCIPSIAGKAVLTQLTEDLQVRAKGYCQTSFTHTNSQGQQPSSSHTGKILKQSIISTAGNSC